MNRRLFFYSVLSVAVSACSSTHSAKQAAGDFEYAKKPTPKELTVPNTLQKPKRHDDYKISSAINTDGPIGKKMDVRAPSLVLPVAAGTRVEIKEPGTKVWFDQVLDDRALEPFVVHAIESELVSSGSSMTTLDEGKKQYQSGWLEKTKEEGFWLWKSTSVINSMKFQFDLETKPHGRSVAVIVKLVDYQGPEKKIDPIDKKRAEVSMLNAVIGQVDYQYRLQQHEKDILRANQKIVSLGEQAGVPAYIVEMALDSLWSNLPVFFERYGFTVTDLNESKKLYYVDFTKPDPGFWTSLWGDEQPVLDLPDGKYQFKLSEQGDNTAVILADKDGEALPQATLQNIFPVIEPGLSFRSTK